ncbi:putative RNA-directed DNA polymerase from transposon X-element [Trichonephila clavipes]|nr:putative RNA-directed DNA polymerase from transposon X-element [Trichonephila clavipes]
MVPHKPRKPTPVEYTTDEEDMIVHVVEEDEIEKKTLQRKGFYIIFSWVPGHVDILGNEQADTAARSISDNMHRPVCYRDLKTSTQNYIYRVWQETWDQQILNELHNIHPSTSHWAALPVRRHDVRLTRLRIGHTRFTHRHLLLGENVPECPSYLATETMSLSSFSTWDLRTRAFRQAKSRLGIMIDLIAFNFCQDANKEFFILDISSQAESNRQE